MPPAQDFRLTNQVVPHTGNRQSLATAVNYLARIAPIVYLAFQDWPSRTGLPDWPSSPAGVQPDSGMDHDKLCEKYTQAE
ncbi:hypothetical protein DSO57_1020324 [Entomophthora muscae]|uniref:Uncharacterized protein n=1 Tax=Entomophthora muscae TaxID=34485 RepID=A0ACC2TQP1_9FUNG|nr:hypothetical protein DSO57_1020324 [Entomophthora muscae]